MLSKEKGLKQDSASKSPGLEATKRAETDEAIPADEEAISAYEHQIQQIFELADICKGIAEDLYPIGDLCSPEERLVMLKIQADCHMGIFRAIVNNATTMVSALQSFAGAMTSQMPQGIVLAQPGSTPGVVVVRPPGAGG